MQDKKKISDVSVRSFGKTGDLISSILIGLLALSSIFPFIFVIIISFTSETSLTVHGYSLIPKEWSLEGYKYLYDYRATILRAIGVSVFVTVVGTFITTTFTSIYAYAISRSNFKHRRFFTVLLLVTMLFGAGMVPNYIVVTQLLGLKDSIWALILPSALSPFNVIVMRTFFRKTVPDAIIESARIDGASEVRIFLQIVLPLAVPGIATISLFSALGYWNDWFNALLYITDKNLMPLQYVLMNIQNNIDFLSENAQLGATITAGINIPRESTRMAMVVISTLPIALSYPFFQKYFVSGLTIGGVKE